MVIRGMGGSSGGGGDGGGKVRSILRSIRPSRVDPVRSRESSELRMVSGEEVRWLVCGGYINYIGKLETVFF